LQPLNVVDESENDL